MSHHPTAALAPVRQACTAKLQKGKFSTRTHTDAGSLYKSPEKNRASTHFDVMTSQLHWASFLGYTIENLDICQGAKKWGWGGEYKLFSATPSGRRVLGRKNNAFFVSGGWMKHLSYVLTHPISEPYKKNQLALSPCPVPEENRCSHNSTSRHASARCPHWVCTELSGAATSNTSVTPLQWVIARAIQGHLKPDLLSQWLTQLDCNLVLLLP